MATKKHTINLEEYITGGGAKCANPKIIWDDPLCAGIRCEQKNGFIVKVTVPDGCEEKCFWGTYYCNDYCNECDPVRIRVCPCETSSECDACSECHPVYKVCFSKCDDGEFCTDHNTCVECDENHPCPDGKQCVGGKCECPPEKPYLNDDGICSPCTDETCPPGKVCTPDGCEDPVCPSGVWHPILKKCVQCRNTGDCGPGECCQPNNTCDCCEGFVRDPVTKLCVKAPCVEDRDCPKCMYCKTGVGCVPKICPEGQVCVDDKCVDECNCSNPNCISQSAACVSLTSETCYCKECAGSCANGVPCGEGCYCDEVDLQCKPNPCSNKPCTDGSECGKGCGCNPVSKKCEPCSSADCGDECNNLLGCHCPNGACVDVAGCDQPCDGYGGCPPGCACDGSQCRPCADFSCATNDCNSHPECKCNGTKCEGDPDFCKDIFAKNDFDCGVGAELTLLDGCMCSGITAYMTLASITKDIPTLNSRAARYSVRVALRLAKGAADTWGGITQLHLLDETQYDDIADNDTPLSGTIDVTIKQFYQPQVWAGGAWINQGDIVSEILPGSGPISFSGIARKDNIHLWAHKIGIGYDTIAGVSQKKAVRYEISAKVNPLSFENNCLYGSATLDTIRLDSGLFKQTTDSLDSSAGASYYDVFIVPGSGNYDLGSKFFEREVVTSSSKRNPLLTWYRSEDNAYAKEEIIRKLYISPDNVGGSFYTDTLYGPANFDKKKQNLVSPEGRVFGDMYYMVTNDCSCKDRNLDLGKMTWCSPDSLAISNIVFSNCNKKVEIKSDIARPCVTNWDLNSFTLHPSDNTTTFKNKHQAKYHLMIELEDGTKLDIPYVWREFGTPGLYHETTNTSIKSYSQTFTSAVVSLKLELRYGTSTEVVCDWTKTIADTNVHTPTYTKICEPNSNNIKYRFMLAPNHISTIVAVGGAVVNGAGYKDIVATQGQTVTAHFTFTDYCPTTMTLNEFCCDTLGITFSVNQVSGTTELTSAVTGGTLPYSVKYYLKLNNGNTELVGESTNSSNGFKVVLSNPTPGLYFATVSDGSGNCSKDSTVVAIIPRDADDYELTITPTFSGCTYTGNVSISIPNETDIIGAKVYYKVNSNPEQFFTVTTQMVTAGFHLLSAVGQTITLVRLEIPNPSGPPTSFAQSGSATVPSVLTSNIPVVTSFTVNTSSSSTNVCEGDDVLIEIQGSANAIVQIDGIAPISLDGSGYGSTVQNPVVTTTYTITGINNSDNTCPGTQGLNLTRQASVTPAPEITIVSDVCDGSGTYRTVTFSNITSATDQVGNTLTIIGNAVTVNVNTVTHINAVYTLGVCTVEYQHPIVACGAPEITGDITAPSSVCAGETATVTVSNVTGGTAPYSYNYYTTTNYNENYVLGLTSKVLLLSATDTVFVRVKDALGNISSIGSQVITVSPLPVPNILAAADEDRVVEIYADVFQISDDVTTAIFKTAASYVTYAWEVEGTYGGTTTGSGSTFSIDVAEITGTITLTVTVTSADGCVGTETIEMYVVPAEVILEDDEILFVTNSFKLYKVQVTPSSIGVPVLVCGAGNPATSIAMRANGDLISANANTLFKIDALGGCGAMSIGNVNHSNALGMLTADIVVSMNTNNLSTFNIDTNTADNSYYTISDGSNSWVPTGDLVRIGNYLYGLARLSGGTPPNRYLLRFTLDGSDEVTAFTNMGNTPNQAGGLHGIAYLGSTAYLVFSDGKVYELDVNTPGDSTLIGTIIVPMAETIFDVTNNS